MRTDESETQLDERAKLLSAARRIVVKLGTNMVAEASGDLCRERLEALAASVAQLKNSGMQVVLVSSGAVGLGRGWLGLHPTRTSDLVTRQACAAVGQALLMDAYQRLFGAHGVKIAQVLLTEDDFAERRRSSNLRQTMEKLLKLGVVPIVNENDTVSTAELEYIGEGGRNRIFSDNDRLAALVASKIDANALILLTNVEGLLQPPRQANTGAPTFALPGRKWGQNTGLVGGPGQPGKAAREADGKKVLVALVKQITPELKALASGPSAGGRGGMLTKLEAAEIAMNAGSIAVIADGTRPDTLQRIFGGEPVGTAFIPAARMAGKRRWIAYAAGVRGRIVINDGACAALLGGKASLLWSGVVKVDRRFKPMDVISIADPEGREFARGIANYGSDEVQQLVLSPRKARSGKQLSSRSAVLVERDNIVVFDL